VGRSGVGLLAAIILASTVWGATPASGDASRATARARAADAYSAMQRYFYSASDDSYAGVYPKRGHAQAWPFSQALWATLRAAPGDLNARLAELTAYSHPEPGRPAEFAPRYGGSGVVYNDDNLWIALALEQLGDPASSRTAAQLFDLVTDGWDTDASHPCPGGVFWTRLGTNRDRNTVTTANAALLALDLYGRSRKTAYLTFASRAYEWTKSCLGRQDGLIADHIDLKGRVDWTTWSYNQGAMIAAAVGLYRATRQHGYLADAQRIASAALKTFRDPLRSGEPPVFLAIFYRDLRQLDAVAPRRAYQAAEEAFADAAWAQARDPKTGLFRFGGRQPTLLDQAAMVQIYAELAGG
jgi:Glycosyl hydrolase family 76